MQVDQLYKKFWKLTEKADSNILLEWVNKLLKADSNDIDLRYIYLEILRWNNLDVEDDQEEPIVLNLCTQIIKNKEKNSEIIIAKAYSYRGEIRYLGIDGRKDFDKALEILNKLDPNNGEVKFLNQFIKIRYPQMFRQYLEINTNYKNMFIF